MDCKFQAERKYETIEVHYIVQNFLTTYYKLKWDSKHTSLNESEALSSTYISGINPDRSSRNTTCGLQADLPVTQRHPADALPERNQVAGRAGLLGKGVWRGYQAGEKCIENQGRMQRTSKNQA